MTTYFAEGLAWGDPGEAEEWVEVHAGRSQQISRAVEELQLSAHRAAVLGDQWDHPAHIGDMTTRMLNNARLAQDALLAGNGGAAAERLAAVVLRAFALAQEHRLPLAEALDHQLAVLPRT